jgi:pyruvate,water dikinase
VVALQLGIPVVVGTRDASRRIRNGTHVTVDGTRGVVVVGTRRRP